MLHSNGHNCVAVGSGMEALDRLASGAYDLVLMDQNMPLMTGTQAIVRLRSNPKYHDLPILMCTARPPSENPGATGFVAKPIDLHSLVDTVVRTIAEKAAK